MNTVRAILKQVIVSTNNDSCCRDQLIQIFDPTSGELIAEKGPNIDHAGYLQEVRDQFHDEKEKVMKELRASLDREAKLKNLFQKIRDEALEAMMTFKLIRPRRGTQRPLSGPQKARLKKAEAFFNELNNTTSFYNSTFK